MSQSKTRQPGELTFVCLLVGFSAVALWQSYGISGFSGLSTPGVFPMLAAATMLVSALAILRDTARQSAPDGSPGFFSAVLPPRLIAVVSLVTVYLFSMPWIGFVVASGLFLFAAFAFLWRKGFVVSLGLALVSLGAVYVLFRTVFQVVLPRGSLMPPGLF